MNDTSSLFTSSEPYVEQFYADLMQEVEKFGPMQIEPKKTSVHVAHKSAFLGVHPKKKWLDLNIVTAEPIDSARVLKTEQVSKNRFHNLVRLAEATEINAELISWLKGAYALKS